jgi:3-isopropylmalate/(R)-2-methylmalate dehydratase large subunit
VGRTITEKIMAKAAGKAEVSSGDYIEFTSDRPITMGYHSPPDKGQWELVTWGVKPFDPTKLKFVDGHYGLNPTDGPRERRQLWRDWCRDMGVPKENLFELGRQGAEQVLCVQKGWALPGSIVANGVNGHSSTSGALGCFAFALSGGLGAYLIEGKTWAKVPETCKVVLTGELQKGVTSRDISEYVLSKIGTSGAVGMVTEWTGPAVDAMSMDERFCLCSVTLFTGAWTSIMNPDDKTVAWVKAHTDEAFEPLCSDEDAEFAKVLEFDVSEIEPQIVMTGTRYEVKPVSEVEGVAVNRGMVGSECNGWLYDMACAASILEGKKIHQDSILEIVPGSQEILLDALDAGYVRTFIEAECVVYTPGTDFNHTPLNATDTGIHSQQTNSPGRAGSTESKLYLGSPYTVAASTMEGKIVDPRKYL